jgi:hypothetical protein
MLDERIGLLPETENTTHLSKSKYPPAERGGGPVVIKNKRSLAPTRAASLPAMHLLGRLRKKDQGQYGREGENFAPNKASSCANQIDFVHM